MTAVKSKISNYQLFSSFLALVLKSWIVNILPCLHHAKLFSKLEIWKQVMLILYLSLSSDVWMLPISWWQKQKAWNGKNCSRCCPSLLSDVWILSSLQPWNLAGLRFWVPVTDCSPTSHEKTRKIGKRQKRRFSFKFTSFLSFCWNWLLCPTLWFSSLKYDLKANNNHVHKV